jgi:ribulose-phosphate 3-epimerase
MTMHIHPSILSADFANFESEFRTISGADAIHVDVMDGHFVPNLTFGLPVVKRLAEVSKLPLDIHLMIENVDDLALGYADLAKGSVTFHQEASSDPVKLARKLRASEKRVGIAVKPNTNLDLVLANLNEFDMVLVMTVEPGFGGQKFMPENLIKVQAARAEIERLGLEVRLQVDGGVDEATIVDCASAGADTFVAGSSVFSKTDRNAQIALLRSEAKAHYPH